MKHVLFSLAAKRRSLRGFTLATGLSILGLASHLNAQAPGDLVANIPFTFQIGPTRMPAGTYVVHQNDGVLTVRQPGASGRTISLMTMPVPRADANQTGLLEFNRYGDTYFLESVWSPLDSKGRTSRAGSRSERCCNYAVAMHALQPHPRASLQAGTHRVPSSPSQTVARTEGSPGNTGFHAASRKS